MTMHLASHAFSTVKNSKHKPRLTKNNILKWQEELRVYNKNAKRIGDSTLTLEQYIDKIHGRLHKSNREKFVPYTPTSSSYRRETPNYPSHDNGIGIAAKTENMRYTGTLVKGIATMHKSNAVPIIDEQQAKEISSMRR